MDENTRGTAIAELQTLLLDTPGVDEFVEGVARAAARHVGAATSATITLRREGRPTLVAASDTAAALCDEVEYAADDGPCLTSIDAAGSSTSPTSRTRPAGRRGGRRRRPTGTRRRQPCPATCAPACTSP